MAALAIAFGLAAPLSAAAQPAQPAQASPSDGGVLDGALPSASPTAPDGPAPDGPVTDAAAHAEPPATPQTAPAAPATPQPSVVPQNQAPPPRGVLDPRNGVRRYWQADAYLVGGFNQLTLALLANAYYRWDQPRSDNILLDNRRFELGFAMNINPGFTSIGAYAEWTPLQILVIRLQTDVYGHYGIYGAIKRYASSAVTEDWSDPVRELCQGCRAGVNQRVLARVALQAQLGPVVLRNETNVGAYLLHGDEPYYILIEHDILAARMDVVINNDTQLLFEPYRRPDKTGLYVGGIFQFARTMVAQVQRMRAGLFGEWVFHRRLGPFSRPRVLGLAGYHIQDRNRGIDPVYNRFIGIIGFGTEFDL